MSTRYTDGLYDATAVFFGVLSIHRPTAVSTAQLLAYLVMVAVDVLLHLYRTFMFYSGATAALAPEMAWQFYLYNFSL